MSQTSNTLWDRCLILAKQAGELLGNGIDPVETEEALEVAIDRFIVSRAELPSEVQPDPQEVRRVLRKVTSQEYKRVAFEIDQRLKAFR